MVSLTALCILAAVLLVLHACATSIADSEELHNLTVRVHTIRNEYLAHLRGDDVVVVDETGPVASIGPDPAAEQQAAAA